MAEDPDKELKTNKLPTPQLEDFRKGQKEMPGVRPPPRILLAGIHLGWAQGRTLSQNNRPKTTWKLILSPLTWDFKLSREVLRGSPTLLFSARCLFPIKPLALSACVSLRTIHSRVLDKSPRSSPGRGSAACNTVSWDLGAGTTEAPWGGCQGGHAGLGFPPEEAEAHGSVPWGLQPEGWRETLLRPLRLRRKAKSYSLGGREAPADLGCIMYLHGFRGDSRSNCGSECLKSSGH